MCLYTSGGDKNNLGYSFETIQFLRTLIYVNNYYLTLTGFYLTCVYDQGTLSQRDAATKVPQKVSSIALGSRQVVLSYSRK